MPADGNLVGLGARDTLKLQQAIDVCLPYRLSLFDRTIKKWLRKERFVAFVVTQPAVRPHINDDIAFELAPEVHPQTHNLRDSFRIFTVHVEDRIRNNLSTSVAKTLHFHSNRKGLKAVRVVESMGK